MLLYLSLSSVKTFSSTHTDYSIVKGKVTDHVTGLPLSEVNISIPGIGVGTTTDSTGSYRLKLPVGIFTLTVSHIGYHDWEQQIEIAPDTKQLRIDVTLQPAVVPLPGVSISGRREQEVSRYQLDATPLRKMASPLPDVLLSLQTLPGVASPNDQSSFYNIRGGNFDENLIYINGVEIYQPQLVRKGIMENPSLVNPYLLQSINLRTGAFPVSYGDKLSSVLDLSYRTQFEPDAYAAGDISAIGVNAAAGVNLHKRVWVQLGVRRIHYGYLFEALETSGNYTPLFQDLQGILHLHLNENLNATLMAIYADSRFQAEMDATTFQTFDRKHLTLDFSGSEQFNYETTVLSAALRYHPHPRLTLNWVGSYFGQNEFENSTVGAALTEIAEFPNQSRQVDHAFRHERKDAIFSGTFYSAKGAIQWRAFDNTLLTTGAEFKYFETEDTLSSVSIEQSDSDVITLDPRENYVREGQQRQGTVLSGFLQAKTQLAQNWCVQAGVRWTHASLNHEHLLMPRVQLLHQWSEHARITFTAGMYAQPPLYKEFQFREGDDDGLRSQKAAKFAIGYQGLLRDSLSFKVEGYLKRYTDLISYTLQDVRIRYSGENDSEGYAFGVDAYLHGDIIPGTENWISYSFLVARENIMGDLEGLVPRPTDRRHQLAIYNEDRMQRLPWSKTFVRVVVGSGYPFTVRKWIWDEATNTYHLEEGARNGQRLPFYFRLDLGFTQEFKIGGTKITLREEILNAFDRGNTLGYTLAFNELVQHHLSGRIVNFGASVEF